jgi:6-phosphofructokinase 1
VLGHLQQGGDPTPFDRILATRYAYRCINFLEEKAYAGDAEVACIGVTGSEYAITPLVDALRGYDVALERPKQQWWLNLEQMARMLAQPGPGFYGEAL